MTDLELAACTPVPVAADGFNRRADLPHGLKIGQLQSAMSAFADFLGTMNRELQRNGIDRLETMMMPANFSSLVGEFMAANIPRFCPTLAKNQYHNGHPDLVPNGLYPNNAVQYAHEGIEIKSSRYESGWQGHNPEDIWLMVFVYDSNRPRDLGGQTPSRPFRFISVLGASLEKADWNYAGRSATSRRTITASVNKTGFQKMTANWLYRAPGVTPAQASAALSQPAEPIDPPGSE